jgi:hypothetical protein
VTWAPECNFALDGFALMALIAAVPLALLLGWLTLSLYRRAINKAMMLAAGDEVAVQPAHAAPGATGGALTFQFLDPTVLGNEAHVASTLTQRSRQALWHVGAVYVIGGAAHAAVITLLILTFNGLSILPGRFAMVWLVYVWPVIPVLVVTAASQRRTRLTLLIGYFVVLVALEAVLHGLGRQDGPMGQVLILWNLSMLPPTILLMLLGNRTLRCVGMIAMMVAITLTLAWLGSFQLLGCLILTTRNATLLHWITPLRIVLELAAAGAIWLLLRQMSASLLRSGMSDQMLNVHSWWLLITTVEMLTLSPGLKSGAPLVFLAYIAYRLVVSAGLRWARQGQPAHNPPQLLVLRVFGHGGRTERLLDELGLRWRHLGPINLIAATDIASSFLEPDELVQFLSGNLGDAYVGDAATLQAKLQRLDAPAFADGRYPLNDFFCRDNTWRACVQVLADRCDAVLMDLRSFGKSNRGCEFELGLLLAHVNLHKVTLLVDQSTDVAQLQNTLLELWQQHGLQGVNGNSSQPTVNLLKSEGQGAALAGALLNRLLAIAAIESRRTAIA